MNARPRLTGSTNHDNLISIETNSVIKQKIDIANKLKLSTVNMQSIKLKDDYLLEYLLESKTDLCIVTETWLRDENEEDGAWVSCTHLNKVPFKISISSRKNSRGGGLALIYEALLPSNLLKEGSARSFQFGLWSTKVQGFNVTLITLYHLHTLLRLQSQTACSLMTYQIGYQID